MTQLSRLSRLLIAGAAALAFAVPGALPRLAHATSTRYLARGVVAALPSEPIQNATAPTLITRPEQQDPLAAAERRRDHGRSGRRQYPERDHLHPAPAHPRRAGAGR